MGHHFTARMGMDSAGAGTVSGAALRQMHFDAHKKSIGVAYLLWFFFGAFGGHRFYAGRIHSAVLQLVSVSLVYALTQIVSEEFSMLGIVTGLESWRTLSSSPA